MAFSELHSSPAANITTLARELRIDIIEETPSRPPDKMIIIGNGTPDDRVLAILCHHHNGKDLALIAKPKDTGPTALRHIKTYIDKLGPVTAYLFLVDQEGKRLEDVFSETEDKLKETGIQINPFEPRHDRLRIYDCRLQKSFRLIVLVNGRDDVASRKHTIEDHLVFAAGLEAKGDSKSTWNDLSEDEQVRIFRRLAENRELAESALPQHFMALRFLQGNAL